MKQSTGDLFAYGHFGGDTEAGHHLVPVIAPSGRSSLSRAKPLPTSALATCSGKRSSEALPKRFIPVEGGERILKAVTVYQENALADQDFGGLFA